MPLFNPPPRAPLLLGMGGAASLTGTTAETVLGALTIPGGLMGPNGRLRVTTLWSFTGSANTKELFLRLGGLSGSVLMHQFLNTASFLNCSLVSHVVNANSQAAQKGDPEFLSGGIGSFALKTSTVDTAADQVLAMTAKLATSSETITLEHWAVELLK